MFKRSLIHSFSHIYSSMCVHICVFINIYTCNYNCTVAPSRRYSDEMELNIVGAAFTDLDGIK